MPALRESRLPDRRRAMATALAFCGGVGAASPADAAEPTWIDQRRVGPFVCRATFPLSDRLLAEAGLERLGGELRRVLALRPCEEHVEVLLVKTAGEHRRLLNARHPDAPYRRALYYRRGQRSVIYAYRHRELAIDLRHEGTHALLHADLPMVPLWLDEGLAEYFEAPAAQRPAGPSHLQRVVRDARRGRLRTLVELEGKHDLAELTEEDYRYAWAWTHFLLHGPAEAAQQLWATLSSLRRFEPPSPISGRLAAVLPKPEAAFLAHFRAWPGVLRAAGAREVARG